MAKVKFIRAPEEAVLNYEVEDGQLLVAKDTGRLWVDNEDGRVELAGGAVKSINGVEPDANGNVEVTTSGTAKLVSGEVDASAGDWLIFEDAGIVNLPSGTELALVKVTCETDASDGVAIRSTNGETVADDTELLMDLSGYSVSLQYRSATSNWKPVEITQASPVRVVDSSTSVSIPTNGLVLESLLEDLTTTTGQTLRTNTGSVSFARDEELKRIVAYFDGSTNVAFTTENLPFGNTGHTKSIWIKFDGDTGQVYLFGWEQGSSSNTVSTISARSNQWTWAYNGDWDNSGVSITPGEWINVVYTHDEDNLNKIYINGTLMAQETRTLNISGSGDSEGVFGGWVHNNSERITAWVASWRIYNRVLDDDEIKALASEYTI